jgi:16S rRNA (guanine527-N7)-methyltransferase
VTSAAFHSLLLERCASAGVSISSSLAERLEAYYRLLITWNRQINLTALDLDALPVEAVDRLFIEPLAGARYVSKGGRVLDIGSGGGSPALPFALAADASALTMVESRNRKSVFLREAARVVELPNVVVLTTRFKGVASNVDVGSFDCATLRAVKLEAEDWRLLRSLLTSSGLVLAFHELRFEMTSHPGFLVGATHQLTANAAVTMFHVEH